MKVSICFIIPLLTAGGAEKVFTTLCKYLDKSRYNITLIVLNKKGSLSDFSAPNMNIIDLKVSRVLFSGLKLRKTLIKLNPDIVLSTLDHLNIYIGLIRFMLPKSPHYIARGTRIASNSDLPILMKTLFIFLYKLVYPSFDFIICQSKEMEQDLINMLPINPQKLVVIPNPVDTESINILTNKTTSPFHSASTIQILAVGRLELIKGHDLLLQALSLIELESYHLTIIGEGSQKKTLTQLCNKLKIEDKVTFLPFTSNPYIWMAHADCTILSSRSEGLSNVMLESLASGTPVIAFDNLGGVKDTITQGKNGFQVPEGNIEQLAYYLRKLKTHKFNLGDIKLSVFKFSKENVLAVFDSFFRQVLWE